jgi:hypothetical protein
MNRPDHISHSQAKELLHKSLDGLLEAKLAGQLEQHLEQCAECRLYAERWTGFDQQLSSSLQKHWPQVPANSKDQANFTSHIHQQLMRDRSRARRLEVMRGLGWSALVILLIVGVAWTVKTLAPRPAQSSSAQSTPQPTATGIQTSPMPSPTTPAISPAIDFPAAGIWSAATDFGTMLFTLDEQPSRITRIDYLFSNWTCGITTFSSEIVDASSWLITGYQFTAYSTFDKEAQFSIEINGAYDPSRHMLAGTWEESAQGTLCSGTWEASMNSVTVVAPPVVAGQFPGLAIGLPSSLPSSPEKLVVYRQQLSQVVTIESARQVATQWGIAGGVYTSRGEGTNDAIFDVMDGARFLRFLNFPDQFIYSVGYTSPDYGSALMDNGPLPSFDEQVNIATSFLSPLGILDMPYRAEPMETERGMVAFTPLLDGYPVIQEIGVDRGNIGWIDVKVTPPGQVSQVQYSHHDFQPLGEYPILSAQQAWERFTADTSLQHSRYAVLSPEGENTYQSWVHKYQPGQSVDIYGWVETYQPADSNTPALVMINNLPIIGNTAGLVAENPYDTRSVHAWGQIQGSDTDGIALNLAGWELSDIGDELITGTLTSQAGQVLLQAGERTFILLDPPGEIPDGLQVGVQGVVLDADPLQINWKFIETGQISSVYGSSTSCGGTGSGGGSSPDANFGGGSFTLFNLGNPGTLAPTPIPPIYLPGEALSGRVYITRHLYAGGSSSQEVSFTPDRSSALDPNWGYSLVGDNLVGVEQYNNMPVIIWGQVERLENHIMYIRVDRYEPVYPGETIQAWAGTEQLIDLDGQQVLLFTTESGQSYVLKSSLDYPPADANIIGRLGDLIEIEGYLMPDMQVGGYTILQDTAGSMQPDGVAESSLVSVWDHTQDPGSNPSISLQGHVTIDKIELAYDATNLDRCLASAANDPNMAPYLVVQPMWVFNGHFDDGRRFFLQVQALPDEYLQ